MKVLVRVLIVFFLSVSQQAFAGYSSSESDIYKFRYDIKGEIIIKPDRALFPLIITAKAGSYKKSLEKVTQIVAGLKSDSLKLSQDVFSITTTDFNKKTEGRKKINLSFFGDDEDNKNKAVTKLVSFLVVSFTDQHNFSARSAFIAESLDFVNAFKDKYKDNELINVYTEDVYYEIADVEQYREKIVSSVYNKAKTMAEIIAKHEKLSARIKEVYFDQSINEEILSFDQAALSISAKIEYAFE